MAPCFPTTSLAPTLTPNQDLFLKIRSLVGVMLELFVVLREVLEAVLETQVWVRTGSSPLTVRAPHLPNLVRGLELSLTLLGHKAVRHSLSGVAVLSQPP